MRTVGSFCSIFHHVSSKFIFFVKFLILLFFFYRYICSNSKYSHEKIHMASTQNGVVLDFFTVHSNYVINLL